jgi:hypothetical protein
MICEVRNSNTEVVLSNITIGDILAFIRVWLSKDKEIVFAKPDESMVESEE